MVLTSTNMVDFRNLETRVRINPETLMRFEEGDMVTLQHPQAEQSVRIKYDIMLILYPMVNWVTVGELCEGWPPDDQEKIKDHLQMLYQSRIIVTSEEELAEPPPSSLPPSLGNVTINIENHHHMLRDSIRMACYRRAIEKAVTPESVVMDLGAGSGILSFFAARAGAKKIYAIEKRPDMVIVARELAKANGFEEQITFIENSSQLVRADEIDPKPTVFVSEILGNAILEENVLEFTMDARDRFLAEGGVLIPASLEIVVAAFDAGPSVDRSLEVDELEDIYGFNFQVLKTVLAQKPSVKVDRFNPLAYTMMSDPTPVINLDFYTIQSATFRQPFELVPTKDGFINGFVAYFKAHMDDEMVLTNSPWAPPTHWTQMVYSFPTRREVKAGEVIPMVMDYEGGLMLWYKDEWESKNEENGQDESSAKESV